MIVPLPARAPPPAKPPMMPMAVLPVKRLDETVRAPEFVTAPPMETPPRPLWALFLMNVLPLIVSGEDPKRPAIAPPYAPAV